MPACDGTCTFASMLGQAWNVLHARYPTVDPDRLAAAGASDVEVDAARALLDIGAAHLAGEHPWEPLIDVLAALAALGSARPGAAGRLVCDGDGRPSYWHTEPGEPRGPVAAAAQVAMRQFATAPPEPAPPVTPGGLARLAAELEQARERDTLVMMCRPEDEQRVRQHIAAIEAATLFTRRVEVYVTEYCPQGQVWAFSKYPEGSGPERRT